MRSSAAERQGAAEDERLAEAIANELRIDKRIADLAVTTPPRFALGSMEALIAQGWFDSVYGSGFDHRVQRGPAELELSVTALEQAEQRFAANPTAQNEAALERARARRTRALDGQRPAARGERRLPDRRERRAPASRGARLRRPPRPAPDASVIGPSQLNGLENALSQLTGAPA